jgi:hypothetical protein
LQRSRMSARRLRLMASVTSRDGRKVRAPV